MEKCYKPIPDVEALKYHGTTEKPDIKIFVSHRIDFDAQTVENPLFIPVRCGAIFDNRESPEMLGDDTGKQISEKRLSFCELTVQYWAWKNVTADYYGLCHYRRYLSFSDTFYPNVDGNQHVIEKYFGRDFLDKYGLDQENMRRIIEKNDIVSLIPLDLRKDDGMFNKRVIDTIRENPSVFPPTGIDVYRKIFLEKYPEYAEDLDAYLNGKIWRGFNCYVMRRPFFEEYNQILFDILEEYEKRTTDWVLNMEQTRMPGYLGEITFAVYFDHIRKNPAVRTTERQLVKVEHTQKVKEILPAFEQRNLAIVIDARRTGIPVCCVTIASILAHKAGEWNYDIVVLGHEAAVEEKIEVCGMAAGAENACVRFIDTPQYDNREEGPEAVIRVMHSYGRALYLRAGVITQTDVLELLKTVPEDAAIAAAVNPGALGGSRKTSDSVSAKYEPADFLNADVLIFNIPRVLLLPPGSLRFKPETKILNVSDAEKGNVYILENSWNVCMHSPAEKEAVEREAPLAIYQSYLNAKNAPKIIRYSKLPCQSPEAEWGSLFWKYARNTPFYEKLLSQLYFSEQQNAITWNVRVKKKVKAAAGKILPKGSVGRFLLKSILNR